ncbi:MAG: hypothetical protein QNJ98_16270 [Planctomycetota bacterium]|nr:hypothetical protein [Planctomycetota bacterium]
MVVLLGCGGKPPGLTPLPPPQPELQTVAIEWEHVSTDEHGIVQVDRRMRLELHPDGSFAYHFRDPETGQAQREPARGRWRARPHNTWILIPEDGRNGLVGSDFDAGVFPELQWRGLDATRKRPPGLETPLIPTYEHWRVPWVDNESGRVTGSFLFAPDIRRAPLAMASSEPR